MKSSHCSVIMATYNCGRYLDEAIQSILKQTHSNLEFIIVDDYSKDNTVEIINAYKKKDKRVKLLVNDQNHGLAYSLNKALGSASGKYIFRMDGDDISASDRIEKQLKYFRENKEVFLLGSGAYRINEKSEIISQFKPRQGLISPAELLVKNQLYHPTICFRNTNSVQYREKFTYAQDYDLYLRIAQKGLNLANLEEQLLFYRVHHSADRAKKVATQYLFAQEAIKSYKSVINQKDDTYEDFDHTKILNYDFDQTLDTNILSILIHENLKAGNRNLAKHYLKKYFLLAGLEGNFIKLLLLFLFRRPVKYIFKILDLKN